MIYVTGDIHAHIDISKLSSKSFALQKGMTKDDYLIICGDFGLVWDESKREMWWRDWLSKKSFTTVWADGNHENFDLLDEIPEKEKFGGAVQEIAPSVFHAKRGQVLTIDGKKIFFMGGASSHDKWHRTEHLSWWEQELPSMAELEVAMKVLDGVNWTVDYVVSHCAPSHIQERIATWYEKDRLTNFFDVISSKLRFDKWFFGHYHIDRAFDDKYYALYNSIIKVC